MIPEKYIREMDEAVTKGAARLDMFKPNWFKNTPSDDLDWWGDTFDITDSSYDLSAFDDSIEINENRTKARKYGNDLPLSLVKYLDDEGIESNSSYIYLQYRWLGEVFKRLNKGVV